MVVTRHPGAAKWVQQLLARKVQTLEHLDPQDIVPGGNYYGVFPINLAAAICVTGAQCWAITMQLPAELRGKELTAEQLDALGATLVRYEAKALQTLQCPYQVSSSHT